MSGFGVAIRFWTYPRPIVVRPQSVVIYEHHPGDHRHWKERGYAKCENKDRYKKYRSYLIETTMTERQFTTSSEFTICPPENPP